MLKSCVCLCHCCSYEVNSDLADLSFCFRLPYAVGKLWKPLWKNFDLSASSNNSSGNCELLLCMFLSVTLEGTRLHVAIACLLVTVFYKYIIGSVPQGTRINVYFHWHSTTWGLLDTMSDAHQEFPASFLPCRK